MNAGPPPKIYAMSKKWTKKTKDAFLSGHKALDYCDQINRHMDLLELDTKIDKMEKGDARDILERGYKLINKSLPKCRPEHRQDYDRVIEELEGLKVAVRRQAEMKRLEDNYYR